MTKKLVILKLGGSVITRKQENLKKINFKDLKRLCAEIAEAKKRNNFSLIIIHGVGPFGHVIAKKFNLNSGYKNKNQIKPITDLYLDLRELNNKVIESLKACGVNAVSLQPSSAWKLENREMKRCNLDVVKKFIELGITPVLYGDLLTDSAIGFSILSGDHIVYYLAKNLKADSVIIGTDTDGVFDSDPKTNKKAKLIKEINKRNIKNIKIGKSQAIDVTGGMKGKIGELLKLAQYEIGSRVINITKPGILEKTLGGNENFGTKIK